MAQTFEKWMVALRKLAKDKGGEFLISDDGDEAHRDAFDDGLSPSDEFDEQYSAAAQACA